MYMSYTQIEVSRNLVRDEILTHLRENQQHLVLSRPPLNTVADRMWFDSTNKTGISVNKFVDTIYERLVTSGKANRTTVPVDDSTIMHSYDAYFPLQIKTIILEEIFELVRVGVLIQVKFKPQDQRQNFNFEFDFGAGFVMLTEGGIRFLAEEPTPLYFVEQYLDRLRRTAEPDDELKGYLSEGLDCLQYHLSRAAAVLLRLAAEHVLNLLIDSTKGAIKNAEEQERSSLEKKINRARMNIEERAEVVFRKLESKQGLVPHQDEVTNRLRPAFHSVRDLGGRAAHWSSSIQLEEVRDHYTLYASSIYTVIMKIIEYQKNPPSA
jgi:hypothetical protein